MPNKFLAPRDIKEAMYIMELGFPPSILEQIPEVTLQKMIIYKNVKDVAMFGGNYDP